MRNYITQLWNAAFGAPSPDAVRARLLNEARLELIRSEQYAEDYAALSEACVVKSRILKERIERLSGK